MNTPRSTTIEKLVAGLALAFAFIVLASIFVPADTHAEDDQPLGAGAREHSTDAHAGLHSLGTLLSGKYEVHIYSTDVGARYTVYDRADGYELSTLITAEKVAEWYPDLPLNTIHFDTPVQLMLAEPDGI